MNLIDMCDAVINILSEFPTFVSVTEESTRVILITERQKAFKIIVYSI